MADKIPLITDRAIAKAIIKGSETSQETPIDPAYTTDITREITDSDREIAKAQRDVDIAWMKKLPFKRTIVGEERSLPNGTEIWFLLDEEYQALCKGLER